MQEANALFQVDDKVSVGTQPIYRLILTATIAMGWWGVDRVQRNATLIAVEGADTQIRYNCDLRRRGAAARLLSPTMKFNIPGSLVQKTKAPST